MAAWEEIYHKCHEPLCKSIRIRLGRLGNDPHLVDEMAARFWYAVVDKDGKRLSNTIPGEAGSHLSEAHLRDGISRDIRSDAAGCKREFFCFFRSNQSGGSGKHESHTTSLSEFFATLTPQEQGFCGDYLLAASGNNGEQPNPSYSTANIWQLTRRVYKKFLNYIGKDPE